MNHGSLFSGIGGFDLAAEWAGWTNVFHCEWNPFGQKVLKHYWPHAESFNDITKTDFTPYANKIDILTGGFPCQPYSSAGKRKGKEDERHLWPEMLRAIREICPRWIVGENVLGLVNWSGGLVFQEVQADLEAAGYEVQPFLLPAAAVNAPHRRDRIWFVAYSNSRGRCSKEGSGEYDLRRSERKEQDNNFEQTNKGLEQGCKDRNATNTTSNGQHDKSPEKNNSIGQNNKQSGSQRLSPIERFGNERNATDTMRGDNKTQSQKRLLGEKNESRKTRRFMHGNTRTQWHEFPTQSPVCSGDDGLPTELDGITFSKWRNESIKAYGNAIVPQVVYQIFKAINEYESTTL